MLGFCVLSFLHSVFIFGWVFLYSFGKYLEILSLSDSSKDASSFYDNFICLLFMGDAVLLFIDFIVLLCIDSRKVVLYIVTNEYFINSFFIPMLIILVFSCVFYIKKKHNDGYIKYNRIAKIKEKIGTVNYFLGEFNKEKMLLDDDYRLTDEQKLESIEIIDSYIRLLQDIYAELRISLSMVEMNYAVEQFKDIELSDTNLESLSKQIDKMKAYRSLGEVSQELKDLLKKYDSGKVQRLSKPKD